MASAGSRPRSHAVTAFLVLLAAAGCRANGAPAATAVAPPAIVEGWEVVQDGLACRHPTVRASCANGWCKIPAGCFLMGSPEGEWGRGRDSEERTAVRLTRSFLIGATEVTRAQFKALGFPAPGVTASYGRDCTEADCPAGNTTWFGALAFANALSAREGLPACYLLSGCTGGLATGDLRCRSAALSAPTLYECKGYRLPSEAEWEYAARAGTRAAFYGGEAKAQESPIACGADPSLDPIAWYCHNSGGTTTHPVGRKRPNAWGLHDTAGNALEWVNDTIYARPGPAPWTDPAGTLEGSDDYVQKGGNAWAPNALLRAAARLWESPDRAGPSSGFRLVRTLFE